jgi:hypothetical protein
MNILLDRCSDQTQLLSRLVDLFKKDQDEALARDLSEWVVLLVDHTVLLERAVDRLIAMLYDEQLDDDIHRIGKVFQNDVAVSFQSLQRISPLVAAAKQKGYSVPEAELTKSAARLEGIKRRLQSEWPSIDYEMIAASDEAHAKGTYQSAESFLNELQGLP